MNNWMTLQDNSKQSESRVWAVWGWWPAALLRTHLWHHTEPQVLLPSASFHSVASPLHSSPSPPWEREPMERRFSSCPSSNPMRTTALMILSASGSPAESLLFKQVTHNQVPNTSPSHSVLTQSLNKQSGKKRSHGQGDSRKKRKWAYPAPVPSLSEREES